MEARVYVETERPRLVRDCLSPSLESDDNVSYSLESDNDGVEICFEASKLGHLRGSSDTVFRLLSLSKKLVEQ